jgi:hypothetical protein
MARPDQNAPRVAVRPNGGSVGYFFLAKDWEDLVSQVATRLEMIQARVQFWWLLDGTPAPVSPMLSLEEVVSARKPLTAVHYGDTYRPPRASGSGTTLSSCPRCSGMRAVCIHCGGEQPAGARIPPSLRKLLDTVTRVPGN